MKQATRGALLSVGLASVVTAATVAVTAASSWATPPSGLTNISLARGTDTNAGAVPYVLFVTFPRVPLGDSARTDQPDPGTCPGL